VKLIDVDLSDATLSVRSAKVPTPDPSQHPSRPSFDNQRDENMFIIEDAPQDHRTAKKKVSPLH
jgi:hypothetical protein